MNNQCFPSQRNRNVVERSVEIWQYFDLNFMCAHFWEYRRIIVRYLRYLKVNIQQFYVGLSTRIWALHLSVLCCRTTAYICLFQLIWMEALKCISICRKKDSSYTCNVQRSSHLNLVTEVLTRDSSVLLCVDAHRRRLMMWRQLRISHCTFSLKSESAVDI